MRALRSFAQAMVCLAACHCLHGCCAEPDAEELAQEVRDRIWFPVCTAPPYGSSKDHFYGVGAHFFNKRNIQVALYPGEFRGEKWAEVQEVAKKWEAIGVRLHFDTGEAPDIIVSLEQGVLSSAIGSDSQGRSPSMFLGGLWGHSSDFRKRNILHEFGHALGYLHEFGNPSAGPIPWNKPLTYAFFKAQENWEPSTVDAQVFQVYDTALTNYSAFDPTSIMLYAVPDSLFCPPFAARPGYSLSKCDKKFGRCHYARPGVKRKCPC